MPAKNILVVDDEPLLEYVIQQRFRKEINEGKYNFTFAPNGIKALEELKSDHLVDMVLTDLKMPEMDGLELLEALKEVDEEVKAVVVSAYGDIKNIRAAMNRGAFDFLTKPVNLQDLEITINKTLEHVKNLKLQHQKLKEAQKEIEFLALHDSLTKLHNRTWLIHHLERAIKLSQRHESYKYALLFIDLDRFKPINDSLGHPVGDKVLQRVADILKDSSRASDTVARLGGDEFAVLIEPLKEFHEVISVTKRIQSALEQPWICDQHTIYLGASVGITTSEFDYKNAEDVLRDADVAMYRAKQDKQEGYAIFQPDMQSSIMERLQLELDLREGLDNQQFRNYYQPIVSLSTGALSGFEVLIRWKHPKDGWLSPTKFIPIAEETLLINPIGWEVLKEACRQLHIWQEQFPNMPLVLNINVSAIQLKEDGFTKHLKELLDNFGIKSEQIKLEITESCLLEQNTTQLEQLLQLKDTGIQLCIDDFGTGYSSLSRLHEFPIDTLKIDRSFTKKMTSDSNHKAIVQMVIALAHTLDMNIVAEGIETEEELKLSKELGCEFGQGYFFTEPLDTEAADEFIASMIKKA